MIWESHEWKQLLTKTASKLSKRTQQKRWTERSLFLLEREVFFAFYAIRKLIEAQKLSRNVIDSQVHLQAFDSKGIPVIRFNRDRLFELYDFENPSDYVLSLKGVCNQIIHSYIFFPCFFDEKNKNSLTGIVFCSDRTRKHKVFVISITEMIQTLEIIGSDYPYSTGFVFDERFGDYRRLN